MAARIELVRTNGIFSLDGEDFEVENNIWLVGDDHEVLVVDAAHDAAPIVAAVGDRRVRGDRVHARAQRPHQRRRRTLARRREVRRSCSTPTTRCCGTSSTPTARPTTRSVDGDELDVAGERLRVVHTPGHSPGGVCLVGPDGHVFGGDTLFKGGPGATGRSFSDFPTIIESIRDRLLVLAPETVVHTGHGDSTTIGDEAPHLDEWIARGH